MLSGQSLAYAAELIPAAQPHRSRGRKKTPKDVQLRRDLHSQAGSASTFISLAKGRGDFTQIDVFKHFNHISGTIFSMANFF